MSIPRFLVTTPLPEPALRLLGGAGSVTVWEHEHTAAELVAACSSGEYSVVLSQLTDRLGAAELADARIDGISNYAVGVDNIDVAAATARGIMVGNTPGVLTAPTADIAMLLILATARRCVEADRFLRQGRFDGWEPQLLLGSDVTGATLGLIGHGRIAAATARRAAGFEMTVRHCSARGPHDVAHPAPTADPVLGPRISFDELIATSDVVSVHVPLAPSTQRLIDADVLARMKPGAILVNTARGPVVDESALVDALRGGVIAGAGLDVYENEPRLAPGLAELSNTVLLPHLGSATVTVRAKMSQLCARNAIAMSRREIPPHPVNPEAWAG
ncbi:2-hydroxyacid dehydrogenase [Rhodococcus sp. NPDC054953]